ncbi:MAG: ADP-forming succinate--CoA ligase subunit beta [Chloroflexi bacterium]|nr:ADP-forming succinate--CoA ligase subunit beta [Chloroflexota bacterium]
MKLHEYQSKALFAEHGVPIPRGAVASSASEAIVVAQDLGIRVVVKAQVLVGGRGKAGGVRLADTPKEAGELAARILAMKIKNLPVRKVLVDEAVEPITEIYLGVTNDRSANRPVLIASAEGGVDIEDVAHTDPEKIVRISIHPLLGLQEFQARYLASAIELPRDYWRDFIRISRGLFEAYVDSDATLAEINPLVITKNDRLMALDGKVVLDDNALFLHPDLAEMRDIDEEVPAERDARKYGLSYVKLQGTIGCMVNGAGLAMASMDVIKLMGGEPANFLDIGGGASAEKVTAGLRIILTDPNVKVVLINVFGGITLADEVARGILPAIADEKPKVPLVVRLVGTNEEEGQRLLAKAKMITVSTLEEAAQLSVDLAKKGNVE